VIAPIVLPWPLQSSLEAMARGFLEPGDRSHIDFSRPVGEAALLSPESVSWRVFKNPLSLFIGGVTAVIMELAEPRVRAGVWEHTTFRLDPTRRLRRTGLAAMVTIYGARSMADPMIARIRRMHEMIAGTTASGEAYRANEPELLNWVHGTAAYGFLQAYHMYVQPLSSSERNRYYAEGAPAASLYGATGAPTSEVELEMLFHAMASRLERSDIVLEFLTIMRSAPILPLLLRPAQGLLVRAAVGLTLIGCGRSWASTDTACILGKPRLSGRQELSQTASFWHPTQPFRLVGGCAFRPITCMSTAAQSREHRSVSVVQKLGGRSYCPVEGGVRGSKASASMGSFSTYA
jgi:uncharacterized protein (DUF2236 family)